MDDTMKIGAYNDNYTAPPVRIDLARKETTESSDLSRLAEGSEVTEKRATPIHNTFDPRAVQAFDPSTIIPKKEKQPPMNDTDNKLVSALDRAVEREKESITQRHKELEEKMYEDYLAQEEDHDSDETEIQRFDLESRDDDLDDDLDSSDDLYSSNDDIKDETYTEKSFNIHDHDTDVHNASDDNEESVHDGETKEEYEEDTVKITRSVADYDENEFEQDFSDDDDDDDDEKPRATDKEIQEREKKEAEKLVNGIKNAAKKEFTDSMFNRIDLRSFKISNKPIKASTVIVREDSAPVADWILYEAGKCISMSGLSGPELIQLDPRNSTRNRVNTLIDIYKIIYNHIVDNKKPSFEKWMMQTKYNDLDHIYFCLYKATFGSSNYISYQCTDKDCEHIFMVKTNFEDMIKYKDDSVKKKVNEIMSQDTNNGIIKYDVDLVQISNKYVFGMRSPSLYNVAMENAGLSDSLIDKYGDMINVINYIDSVYTIDYANKTLIPIDIPTPKENNPVKAATKKIKVLYRIFKCLSSDEFYNLRSYAIKCERKAGEDITYFVPETVCPECGKKIPAVTEDMNANALLFTRHHLGAFASM